MKKRRYIQRAMWLILWLILALPLSAQQKQDDFRRDIEMKTFVPKGQWIVGNSISYSEHNENNYNFLVVEGINSDGYTFKVSPLVCYAFKDNLAAGARFSYGRTLTKLKGATINLDEDNQFDIDDLYQLKHTYGGMAMMRSYISLGNSKRFGLYCDIQLEIGGSQSKAVSGSGEDVTGTYSTSTDLGIGVAPGMVAFINNYMAVEVSVGVLGFDFSKKKQTTNQIYFGEQSLSSANFRINLFSIGLGIAFYL